MKFLVSGLAVCFGSVLSISVGFGIWVLIPLRSVLYEARTFDVVAFARECVSRLDCNKVLWLYSVAWGMMWAERPLTAFDFWLQALTAASQLGLAWVRNFVSG